MRAVGLLVLGVVAFAGLFAWLFSGPLWFLAFPGVMAVVGGSVVGAGWLAARAPRRREEAMRAVVLAAIYQGAGVVQVGALVEATEDPSMSSAWRQAMIAREQELRGWYARGEASDF